MPWGRARQCAFDAVSPVDPVRLPLARAAGAVLAEDAVALTDLPVVATCAMDGWVVAGAPPWRVAGQRLAGRPAGPSALRPGTALAIATGSVVPGGARCVLRHEWGELASGVLSLAAGAPTDALARGRDIRPAAEECRAGDVVLPAGQRLRPAALGLLAAAGLDDVAVRQVHVDVLVLGDELVDAGPSGAGLLRDAIGPVLVAWLPAIGARLGTLSRVVDQAGALAAALAGSSADVVVTTGSTARGPVDHLHEVLARAGARLVVDGVAVRPGHPQVLAVLPDGRPVVGLPGNPLAAVSGVVTLLEPALAALAGAPFPATSRLSLAVDVSAGAEATRLVPVCDGRPALHAGPAMLRGLATAEVIAVVPPGGARAGEVVEALPLP